jgi:hypothetical protein
VRFSDWSAATALVFWSVCRSRVADDAVVDDLQVVAQQRGVPQLRHQRHAELVEGVRQDDHLEPLPQPVEERGGARAAA